MDGNQSQAPVTPTDVNETPKETQEDGAKKNSAKSTVSIEKATLEKILSQMEAQTALIQQMQDNDKKRTEEIEMLKNIADKGRMAKYEDKNRSNLVSTARVSLWNGVPILAWSKILDEVGFRDGKLQTRQVIRIFLDELQDGQPRHEDLDYLFWAQNTVGEVGEVIKKETDQDGTYWTIQMKDGRHVKLDIRFINAF